MKKRAANEVLKIKPVEEEEEEEDIFIVDDILDHRIKNGKLQYLLKWKAFDSDEASWEDESNLDCPELVEKYRKKISLENQLNAQKNIVKDEAEIRSKHPTLIISAFYEGKTLYYRVCGNSPNSYFSAPADELRNVCPELICKYLENKIK